MEEEFIYFYSPRNNVLWRSVLSEEEVCELIENHKTKTIYFFATASEAKR